MKLPSVMGMQLTFLLVMLLGVLATLQSGCGSKAVTKAVQTAKKTVSNTAQAASKAATQAVQQAATPDATSFSLTINKDETPLVISNGKAEVAELPNRPAVVMFASTPDKSKGEYPKLLVWVQGEAGTLAELTGKSVEARVFMQMKDSRPAFSTQREKPAKVLIEAGDATYVTAKIESAELVDSTGQEVMKITGALVGLIPQPPPEKVEAKEGEEKGKKAPTAKTPAKKAEE